MKTNLLEKPTLSSRIKSARKQADITQEELAQTLNLSKQQVWNYEHDKSQPSPDQLLLIADTCKVDPGWLLSGRGNPF
jgi:transcriptional regulator with XRE-family HTH domain